MAVALEFSVHMCYFLYPLVKSELMPKMDMYSKM